MGVNKTYGIFRKGAKGRERKRWRWIRGEQVGKMERRGDKSSWSSVKQAAGQYVCVAKPWVSLPQFSPSCY